MEMVDKLPKMSDEALAALWDNAECLEQHSTPPQRFAALALLPAIGAELKARRDLPGGQPRTRAVLPPPGRAAASPAKLLDLHRPSPCPGAIPDPMHGSGPSLPMPTRTGGAPVSGS